MRLRLIAFAAAATLMTGAPALAQSHDHGSAAPAGHGHAHADFQSGRFHVRVDGPENPIGDVILIPGLSSSPHVWDGLTETLKGRYRVHRIHVQGFAGAEPKDNASGPILDAVAQDLARYIAEQGLNKPAVIGHSMGGTFGMMLAARHPDSVGRLMVVDMIPFTGAMFATPGVNPTVEAVTPAVDAMHARSMALSDEGYAAQVAASVTGMIKTESLRAGPLRDAATSDRSVSANAYRELMLTDLRAELPRITAPVQVLYVAFEFPGMTPEITDTIYRMSFMTLPSAQLKRINDSAHFIMLDQPERFTAEVNAFLD
ncbi:MAG TPA: alpha/beta hydrolase [Brevundimonas sp.]|mgnify:CR=1 FL=1|uniref:alpha/beta fold hydrolase n=1 Tax=Brevundimonas sp. TaxID=1871086 RepID=UPI00260BEB58|nr:alpha/beta hydrolase [Brevundimonas sp.]HRO33833.1 alpha/beta hydrolase [Brevundimonas sp.]